MKYFLTIVTIYLFVSSFSMSQNLYERFNRGPFKVGFAELSVIDYGRSYKNDFRSIQIALWYPTQESGTKKVKILDYFKLYNTEDKFEDTVIIPEFWREQIGRINKNADIEKLLDGESYSAVSALPKDFKYPLILYAAGGQGESFENFIICELLASHGFVVAAIPSMGTYIHEIEITPEGLATQTNDLLSILRFLNQQSYINPKKVGVFGWSWGALAGLYLQTIYPYVDAFASLDGSVAGHREKIEKMPFYGLEKITAPSLYFTTTESTIKRTKAFYEEAIYSDRTFISLDSIDHGHFNSYNYIAQIFDRSSSNKNILKFYTFLTNTVIDFFNNYIKNDVVQPFQVESEISLIDTILFNKGIKPPLREDQLINLLRSDGVEAALKSYKEMKASNPDYIPFEAFELTKVAFSFARDSVRSDDAVKIMEMVLEEYPHSASSYALKGRIHEIRQEYVAALHYFSRALGIKSKNDIEEELVFYEDPEWYRSKIAELRMKLEK